jgi:hypothetical protein
MMIIGVDYHPSFQAIAFCEAETGECGEQERSHSDGQAERFYRDLKQRGIRVRVREEKLNSYCLEFEQLHLHRPYSVQFAVPLQSIVISISRKLCLIIALRTRELCRLRAIWPPPCHR